jgi:hypothetical protein
MRKPTAFTSISMATVLLAWSGSALAQASSIELIEAGVTAKPRHGATTESMAPKSGSQSSLRQATRSHDSLRERTPQRERSQIGVRHSGASAGMKSQSEVAEHRQEGRGAAAGKAGGSGKGAS